MLSFQMPQPRGRPAYHPVQPASVTRRASSITTTTTTSCTAKASKTQQAGQGSPRPKTTEHQAARCSRSSSSNRTRSGSAAATARRGGLGQDRRRGRHLLPVPRVSQSPDDVPQLPGPPGHAHARQVLQVRAVRQVLHGELVPDAARARRAQPDQGLPVRLLRPQARLQGRPGRARAHAHGRAAPRLRALRQGLPTARLPVGAPSLPLVQLSVQLQALLAGLPEEAGLREARADAHGSAAVRVRRVQQDVPERGLGHQAPAEPRPESQARVREVRRRVQPGAVLEEPQEDVAQGGRLRAGRREDDVVGVAGRWRGFFLRLGFVVELCCL